MRRRRTTAVLVAVALVTGGGTAAWAQTTTTEPTVTTTTTQPPPATTTTPHPCAGQPCAPEPPNAVLSGSRGEVQVTPRNYCWLDPTAGVTHCAIDARAPGAPRGPSLSVHQGETLTLRFVAALQPTEVAVHLLEGVEAAPLRAANPTQFTVDLPPGTHDIDVFSRWLQGHTAHGVRLEVAPAPTTVVPTPDPAAPAVPVAVRGRLSLTG